MNSVSSDYPKVACRASQVPYPQVFVVLQRLKYFEILASLGNWRMH